MKKLTPLLLVGLAAALPLARVHAQFINYTTPGSTLSENFDGLISSGNVGNAFSATIGAQSPIPNLTGWQGAKIAGAGTTATNFTANDGSATSGGLYSYGPNGSTDRALGALASGTNTMAFGAAILNQTGITLTEFTITYDGEFWRSSTNQQNTLSFFYGFDVTPGVSPTNFLSSTGMIAHTPLDLVGPSPVTNSAALDGNLAANRTAGITSTITGLNWQPGQILFIAWRDFDNTGSDAGLAVDNFTFTAIPEPSTWALIALGIGFLLFRLRRKNA
ncbi:MAG: PEP-CTERM sorting domain-containing protein [Methylacidiphilales bacterium]|nr:PEP-CTERM sorting domain-containing protein [Candidatus Methylacidiphilales bacterium]MDW8349184.1 PEP-CTERM sorting domain-containing protein [Verrucomicrobiae bacterium]